MPPTAPPTPADLLDHLARAAAAYYRHFADVASRHGLTLMQGKTLSLLSRPMPMRGLAGLLGCDTSNVTGIVDRLQARGLLRREVDPTDRRVKNVRLTGQGEQAVQRIRAELMSGLTGLEHLDREDRLALQRLLTRVFPATGAAEAPVTAG